MVDVTDKEPTDREARAEGFIRMNGEAFRAAMRGSEKKGDVLAAARIAGISGRQPAKWSFSRTVGGSAAAARCSA